MMAFNGVSTSPDELLKGVPTTKPFFLEIIGSQSDSLMAPHTWGNDKI